MVPHAIPYSESCPWFLPTYASDAVMTWAHSATYGEYVKWHKHFFEAPTKYEKYSFSTI